MKLARDGGESIGRQYYRENEADMVRFTDSASSYIYEKMTEEEKAKVNKILLSRKRGLENLEIGGLNERLQKMFGEYFTLPEKWWLDYFLIEKLGASDDEFIEEVTIVAPNDPKKRHLECGWEAVLKLSPTAANERIAYIIQLIDGNEDEMEYIKRNIECAVKYRRCDEDTIRKCLVAWASDVLEKIRNYLYDLDLLRTFDEMYDYRNQEDGWDVLVAYGRYWDMDRAEKEEGFVNKYTSY